MWHPADDLAEQVDEPCLYTFTAHLPFLLGIPDELGHTIRLHIPFADPEAQEVFGEYPFVNIRVFTAKEPGLPMWAAGAGQALMNFYGHELHIPEDRYGMDSLVAHDQWVTLETPSPPTDEEVRRADPAFAFHRCLFTFNFFLRGVQAATHDIRIRPVSSHDFRPVVTVGALIPGEGWKLLTEIFMHPEAHAEALPLKDGPITEEQLNAGLAAVATEKPYVTTVLWRSRAQRALKQTGDAADAIISFQIAAESLLFDTYRMLLIDEGLSSAEVQSELDKDLPFKSLLTKIMPAKLGGQWNVTKRDTPVGAYWEHLYTMRNSVVHRGLDPHGGHAQAAQEAYWGLRDHLEGRLLEKRNTFPRTALARFGTDGLEKRGAYSRRIRAFYESVEAEPGPWYWPHDVRVEKPAA